MPLFAQLSGLVKAAHVAHDTAAGGTHGRLDLGVFEAIGRHAIEQFKRRFWLITLSIMAAAVDRVPRILSAAKLASVELGLAQVIGLLQFLREVLPGHCGEPDKVVLGETIAGVDTLENVHHPCKQRLLDEVHPVFSAQSLALHLGDVLGIALAGNTGGFSCLALALVLRRLLGLSDSIRGFLGLSF
ncbi:hypothetical protein D3C85_1230060 [compost metagenome]